MNAPSRSDYLFVSLTILGVFGSGTVHAAKVSTSFNVAPSLTYTDNVCLTSNNKKDDWIARITPGGSVRMKGKRASLNVSGSVDVNSLTNSQLENSGCGGGEFSEQREQYAPNIRATGSVNVIRNHLNVGFGARADQNAINPRFASPDDRLDRLGNNNNYYRYNIAPQYTTRVGSSSSFLLNYNYDVLLNDKNKANDSVLQTVSGSLSSRSSSAISWGLTGIHREIKYTNSIQGLPKRPPSDRQSARLQLGYRLSGKLSVNGTYGYDFNNIKTNNKYDQSGNAWSLGLTWTPNRRTSVTVGSGDRFFGSTPTVNIRYKRQRSSFNLGYDKRIRYDRDIRTQSGGDLNDFGGSQSLNSRDPIIDERLNVGYNWDGNNLDISLRGSHSDQTRTLDNSEGTFIDASLTVTPVISSRFSLSYFLNWAQDEPNARFGLQDQDSSEIWSAGVSYNRPINKRLNFGLTYQFTDRQSDLDFGDYQENRIEARLGIAL